MNFTSAQAFLCTESLFALSIFLQHLENLRLRRLPRFRRGLFSEKPYTLVLSFALLAAAYLPISGLLGFDPPITRLILQSFLLFSLLVVSVSFGGAFNGGADQMSVQIALALTAADVWSFVNPDAVDVAQRLALSYIAIQLGLSYFMSGMTKLKNPDWRSGRAVSEILQAGHYDIPHGLRDRIITVRTSQVAWPVLLFEILFPLALVNPRLTLPFLLCAFVFHLLNFAILGLNRFVFAWLAAYPAAFFLAETFARS